MVGCGGPYDASVTGVVTLDGTPLSRGTVAFTPVEGGPGGYSPIQTDGTYSIHTGRELGLPSGGYKVTVVANEPPAMERTEQGGPPPSGKPITPPWYRSSQTSGLEFQVERGKNTIDLPLTTDPPPNWKPVGNRPR
jgi:hypothetical protein